MLRFSLFVTLLVTCIGALKTPQESTSPPKPIYSIYVPRLLRRGHEVAASVQIFQTSNPIEVTLEFSSADWQIHFTQTVISENWPITKLVLGEIPIDYKGSNKFNFTVVGVDLVTSEVIFKTNTTDFKLETKSLFIMIQTNKAIYQPGQMMNFRAICMKPDLRPLTGVVTYKVQDPKGNVVYLKADVILNKGVAEGKLNFSRNAIEGKYTVIFEYKGTVERVAVNLKSYKLPKFEVKVTSPQVIYPDFDGFNVYLSANYTFRQPVFGNAVLRLERKTRYGNSLSPPRVYWKKIKRFEGKATIMITKEEFMANIQWDRSDQKLDITAFVTETVTSTTLNGTTMTDLKNEKFKVEVLSRSQVAKPGLKYKALIKVSEQDGNLMMESDRMKHTLEIAITYSYKDFKTRKRNELMNLEIPPNGLVPMEIDLQTDDFNKILFRASISNTSRTTNHWSTPRALSPSNTFMQVFHQYSPVQKELTVGGQAEIFIRATEPVNKLRVMILARGAIIQDSLIMDPIGLTQPIIHRFNVTQEMTPSVLILASYIRGDNIEIVADSLTLNVALSLQNQMRLTTDQDSVDVGSILSINVTTSSQQSYVGLRAVDKSVELLGRNENNVTLERVEEELKDYSARADYYNVYFAAEVFLDAKINVLTNALLYNGPDNEASCSYRGRGGGNAGFAGVFGDEAQSSRIVGGGLNSLISYSTQEARDFFPETWLWTSAETRDERSVSFNVAVPDTITSWYISAFSMSESQGLGIAAPQELTVFRRFFISLNMPLKITRGEIVIIQAIVFNYFEEDLTVNVRLHELASGVELLHPNNEAILGSGPIRLIVVPAGGTVSVKYPLRISILGEILIRVTANSSLAIDSVVRNIFVKPEGIPQCYSSSILINKYDSDIDTTVDSILLRVPQGVIPGSVRASLHTYGDILGSTMTNLGRLLKVPTGCGEQNMLSFAPDIFVTLYLQGINKLSEEMKKNAFQNIVDGYMNQLKFKRSDGSFSAFGESDNSGSTWLTAFVVKCFNYAQVLQPNLIEKSVINNAIDFLLSQQDSDGSFKEPGRVIHQAMQGGVNSPATMTAYVLITLTETDIMRESARLSSTIESATEYLENMVTLLHDPYELALVTYALTLSNSIQGEYAFRRLANLATIEGGLRWTQHTTGASMYSSRWEPPYTPPASYQIEAISYLLLTSVAYQDITPAIPQLKWLVSKQNDLGGYTSTQDTVMAVQALWKVFVILRSPMQNLDLTITHSNDMQFEEQVTITEQNSLVYNTIDMTPLDGTIEVTAMGSGNGVAQLSVCYNIPSNPYEEEPFRCTMNVTNANNDNALLEFCCALREGDMNATGMFLFEIGLLNGFTIDVFDEETRNPMAKLIELDDDRVNVYYDQLLPNDELCASLKLLRIAEIAAIKPATMKAFEYYKPEKVVVRQYNVTGLDDTGVCDVCGYECIGCPAPVLSDWKQWSPCVEFCEAENSTREQECVDPSLGKKIDFFRCEIDDIPTETRICNKTFRCPDASDGLWNGVPESFFSFQDTPCRLNAGIFYRRSPYTGIPGTLLDGYDQSISCSINILNLQKSRFIEDDQILQNIDLPIELNTPEFIEGAFNNTSYGFSVSFLAKPHFYREEGPVVFLSVGAEDHQPFVILEKPIKRNHIRFAITRPYAQKRDIVDNIPLDGIPVGEWSHIIIAWNELSGAKVFVNGVAVGESLTFSGAATTNLPKKLDFKLGRKGLGDQFQQGYFPGSFSSLHYWTKTLRDSEVQGLSEYYKEIVKNNETEPLLSVRHLREFAPPSQRECFNEPKYLSHIYAGQKCG